MNDASWIADLLAHGLIHSIRFQHRDDLLFTESGLLHSRAYRLNLAAAVGKTNQEIYAAMRGESLEDFQKTRKNAVLYSVAGTHKAKAKAERESAAKRRPKNP